VAKTLTYALLFGASDGKLGETAGRKGEGKAVRNKMDSAYSGLKAFTDKLSYSWSIHYHAGGRGFVYGIGGHKIFCQEYKAFNALLQGFEAATCKSATIEAQRIIKAEGLDADIIAHIHDEMTYDVADKDSARVAEILEYSFGPFLTEKYSLNIQMSGTAKIGKNWQEVH
jgi:DNA polymerase I-like protein with 3'-5' exonuclease and polymerase domains